MTNEHACASTRASRVVRAGAEELYAAFLDAEALVDWLPPAEMTGEIHQFDAGVGGGYRMSLFYPPGEHAFRGKTSEREDMVDVRFVELAPPHRIVEAVNFITTDPRNDAHRDIRTSFRRNRSHAAVREPAARLTGGGQRDWLAPQSRAAGPPLRITGRKPDRSGACFSRFAPYMRK